MHALPAGHIQRERVAAELLLLREKLECGRGEHEYAVEQVRAHEILRHNMSSRGNGNADTDADAERSTKWVGRGGASSSVSGRRAEEEAGDEGAEHVRTSVRCWRWRSGMLRTRPSFTRCFRLARMSAPNSSKLQRYGYYSCIVYCTVDTRHVRVAGTRARVHRAARREQQRVREHALERRAREPPPPLGVQRAEQLVEAVAEEAAASDLVDVEAERRGRRGHPDEHVLAAAEQPARL